MKQYIIDGVTVLEPEDNKTLTDYITYSKLVFLGKYDKVEKWHEIPDSEVPEETETPTDEEFAEVGKVLLDYEHN